MEPLTALDWEEIFNAGQRAIIPTSQPMRSSDFERVLSAMARKAGEIARRPGP